jgi:hypothetical protein
MRILSPSAIKEIATHKEGLAKSVGIRIYGAIFCDKLDLVGLEINQSLVIDRSVFVNGIDGRGFRTHGDLSAEESLILGELRITRARIDGSIYGKNSLMMNVQILDSIVQGSIILRGSFVLELAIFDSLTLSGELGLRDSFVSYFLLQFSKVDGALDLTSSQARCAYLIRKSEIGGFVAVNSGFGTSNSANTSFSFNSGDNGPYKDLIPIALAYWSNGPPASDTECKYSTIAFPGAFHVSDTRVHHSFCFRSFHWLSSETAGKPTSYVSFDDVDVDTIAFIDLALDDDTRGKRSDEATRKLEIVGFAAHSFIFNFAEDPKKYELSLNGLKFDHAYTIPRKPESKRGSTIKCGYNPNFDTPVSQDKTDLLLDNNSHPSSDLRTPRVSEVVNWLSSNTLDTTQPYTVFVDAFANDGGDKDAKEFQVVKASTELGYRACPIFSWLCRQLDLQGPKQTTVTKQNEPQDRDPLWRTVLKYASDFVVSAVGFLLWALADHGFHPEKVGWYVGGTLLLSAIVFWLCLRMIAFTPDKKTAIRPIGLLFLFDRLLPAYQIRQDHYNIQTYYKWIWNRSNYLPGVVKTLKYFWIGIPVVKADEKDVIRAEICLDVLKVIGLILAIFLVAAINALVNH